MSARRDRSARGSPGFALHHGLQLAAAIVAAYGLSRALHLPEAYWAVISVLIVSRPDAAATARLGWERVRATMLGAAAGVATAWAEPRVALGGGLLALLPVTAFAFASGWASGWRTAAIAALIVADGGSLAGHSAVRVALLRTLEIAVGVASGLAAAWIGSTIRGRRRAKDREAPPRTG